MENRIKQVISAVFEVPLEEINNESSPDTIESWDSLKHMQLVVSLEEEFKITIEDDEIGELLNYLLICNLVESKT